MLSQEVNHKVCLSTGIGSVNRVDCLECFQALIIVSLLTFWTVYLWETWRAPLHYCRLHSCAAPFSKSRFLWWGKHQAPTASPWSFRVSRSGKPCLDHISDWGRLCHSPRLLSDSDYCDTGWWESWFMFQIPPLNTRLTFKKGWFYCIFFPRKTNFSHLLYAWF